MLPFAGKYYVNRKRLPIYNPGSRVPQRHRDKHLC